MSVDSALVEGHRCQTVGRIGRSTETGIAGGPWTRSGRDARPTSVTGANAT